MVYKFAMGLIVGCLLVACGDEAGGINGGGVGQGGASSSAQSSSSAGDGCYKTQGCPTGTPCGGDEDCLSGFCTDGVCCESECTGLCQACSSAGMCQEAVPGSDPMSDCETSGGVCDTAGSCASGQLEWAGGFGAPVDTAMDGGGSTAPGAVATDAAGNRYVVGSFNGQIDFGGGMLASAGSNDIYVVSLTPSGTHRWSHRFGNVGHDVASGVTVAPSGAVFVVGIAHGDPGFGAGWPKDAHGSGFILQLDSSGTHVGSKVISATERSRLSGVAVSGTGDVFVAGGFWGALEEAGTHQSAGDLYEEDGFVLQLDASLNSMWAWRFGSDGKDYARGLALSGTGSLAVVGFVSTPLTTSATGDSELDGYVAMFVDGPSASPTWKRTYSPGTGSKDKVQGAAFLPSGDLVITGFFGGTVDLGEKSLTSAGAQDVLLARLKGTTGLPQWAHRFGSASSNDVSQGVAVDANSNIVIGGRFNNTVDFGGAPLHAQTGDMFVAKFSDAGDHIWSHGFGSSGTDAVTAVAADDNGYVCAAGTFQGSMDLGPGMLLAPADETDMALLTLAP